MLARTYQVTPAWAKRVGAGLAAAFLMMGVANATTTYTYDGQGRITQVVYDNGTTVDYSYDAAGNRTTVATGTTIWNAFYWNGANWVH